MSEAAKRQDNGGSIINFLSSIIDLCPPTYGIYEATKAVLKALTYILEKTLANAKSR